MDDIWMAPTACPAVEIALRAADRVAAQGIVRQRNEYAGADGIRMVRQRIELPTIPPPPTRQEEVKGICVGGRGSRW